MSFVICPFCKGETKVNDERTCSLCAKPYELRQTLNAVTDKLVLVACPVQKKGPKELRRRNGFQPGDVAQCVHCLEIFITKSVYNPATHSMESVAGKEGPGKIGCKICAIDQAECCVKVGEL